MIKFRTYHLHFCGRSPSIGLDDLQPGNSKCVRVPAVKVFERFLHVEEVEHEYMRECIENDESGQVIVSVMD